MTPRVLISDSLSPMAIEIFKQRGCAVTFDPSLGKDKERLLAILKDYDGLAIRSATKVTDEIMAAAPRLRVIGRAGIGVDNVDIPAATTRGIIVMNTPFGNAVTTAEHAIALLCAVARQIPEANVSTQAGRWEKSKFMGTEITGKTLGIIGCGNIGSVVAERAIGLRMKPIVFDPFLSEERARNLGVEKVSLETLFQRADFITLHTPLTDKTRNIINAEALAKMKKGVYLINCARGGLVDEVALRAALESGQVAGAGVDVFAQEPATENILFGAPNLVATPHLGASTTEAQEKVALQIAEQMADYLTTGAVTNALNMPSVSAEEAPLLAPFLSLAEQLGSFAGQLTESGLRGVRLEYEGRVGEMNLKALTSAALVGILRPVLQTVNRVSAPVLAQERSIHVEEVRREKQGVYESCIRLILITDRQERSVAGTVYSDGKPRIVQVKDITMEAELGPYVLYVNNEDKPGFIGNLGTLLGRAGINIATFHLGRLQAGGEAIALIGVDSPIKEVLLEEIRALPPVRVAKLLTFPTETCL